MSVMSRRNACSRGSTHSDPRGATWIRAPEVSMYRVFEGISSSIIYIYIYIYIYIEIYNIIIYIYIYIYISTVVLAVLAAVLVVFASYK